MRFVRAHAPLVLLAALAACTLAFALGRGSQGESLAFPHGDANYHYVYLPSLWLDGDIDLTNQYAVAGDPWQHRTTPTGRPGNVFGIGAAIFESPLFLTGHIIARATGGRGDGFSSLAIVLAGWASVLASIGAMWFAYRLMKRRLGAEHRALAAALLAFAGGPMLFHAIRQPGMAHPFAMLFTAWLVEAWDASYDRERTLRTWLGLGALLGCAMLARPQLVTWGLCLVVAGIADLRVALRARTLPRTALRLTAGIAAALVCVLPQLVAWRVNYGRWFVVPQGEGFMRWDAPAWSETLFSSRNGLLPWAPLYAIALVGLIAGARRAPRLVAVFLVAIAAQTIVNGAAWDWWAGGSLGGRRFDSAYIAFAFGLGIVLVAARRHRLLTWAAAALTGWLAIANVVLTLQTTPHTMRMKGGEAAADVITESLGPVLGAPVGWLSRLSNLPARIVFALRHDTSLAAYDEVVGVHWLAETYPALTTKVPRTVARRQVADIPPVFRDGGRLFIGVNRRGPVHVELGVVAAGPVDVTWNGETTSAQVRTSDGEQIVAFDVRTPRRGINTLGLRAPPGSRLVWIELRADPDP